jgi:signal-transduction protein with cAMP-binding, CBS, and nucleotidyltransferase domain
MVMVDDELLGIVTERDYARKVIIKGRSSKTTRVSEIMTTGVFTTSSTKSVNDCMSLMTEKRIRHLPVLEGNRVIGMISIGDLVQAIISDQKEEIEQLENYISGM